jgi:hypothetical protein
MCPTETAQPSDPTEPPIVSEPGSRQQWTSFPYANERLEVNGREITRRGLEESDEVETTPVIA